MKRCTTMMIAFVIMLSGLAEVLVAQNNSLRKIVVIPKVTYASNVNQASALASVNGFISQLVAEMNKRFPCVSVSSQKDISDSLKKAKAKAEMGDNAGSSQNMADVNNMLNTSYILNVSLNYANYNTLVNTSLLDMKTWSSLSDNSSGLEDYSASSTAEVIKGICDGIETDASPCPWKGNITLAKSFSKDTSWTENGSMNVPGGTEPGSQLRKTVQTSSDKEIFTFKVFSPSVASCNVQYTKKDKLLETDKWTGIRCWAPNGDASYPSTSTVICTKETSIIGSKDINPANAYIENLPGSELFKVIIGIPDITLKSEYTEKCSTEDDCNAKKETNKSYSGDAVVYLTESYELAGFKIGSTSFKSSKTWKDMEGYTITLDWDLKK